MRMPEITDSRNLHYDGDPDDWAALNVVIFPITTTVSVPKPPEQPIPAPKK